MSASLMAQLYDIKGNTDITEFIKLVVRWKVLLHPAYILIDFLFI
jgi:hypothetical protein